MISVNTDTPMDVYSYDILDTAEEKQFNDLVELAALICDCPISTITFIDKNKNRQWFKARKNIEDHETPLEVSFCRHAVANDAPLIVEDATVDEEFHSYSNVTGGIQIRFYAGAPVRSSSGKSIGTICVIDTKPRHLNDVQIQALEKLSQQAALLLELRLLNKYLQRKSERLITSAESYRDFFNNAPAPQWIVDMKTYKFLAVNKAAQKLYGYTADEFQELELWDIVTVPKKSLDEINEEVRKNGKVQVVTNHKKKNGKEVVVEVTLSTIIYEGRAVIIATTVDLSEKLELQQDLLEEKQQTARKIETAAMTAQTMEREYLGRELHDNINQMLACTCMCLEVASSDDELRVDLINRSKEHLMATINEVRSLSHKLTETSTKGFNLTEAIKELLEPYQLHNSFELNYTTDGNINTVPVDIKISLLRIMQESLQNIAKYAAASKVWIKLNASSKITLSIKDNGKGFDTSTQSKGIGLRNINERAQQINGTAEILSAPGKGCTVKVVIPL